MEVGSDGASFQRKSTGMIVIASMAREQDGKRWVHLSCSHRIRLPTWEEVNEVRNDFLGRDKKAIHILETEEERESMHPNVLHLWHCLDEDPLPDFTRGTGSI